HERIHLIGICDISFEKLVALAMFFDHAVQIGEVARVSEHIDVGHVRRLGMLQNIPNKVAPDESAATGYKDAHGSEYYQRRARRHRRIFSCRRGSTRLPGSVEGTPRRDWLDSLVNP